MRPSPDKLFAYIVRYKAAHDGNSPTMREIVGAGVAGASTSVASYTLHALEQQGRIRLSGTTQARSIEVVGGRWLPPE